MTLEIFLVLGLVVSAGILFATETPLFGSDEYQNEIILEPEARSVDTEGSAFISGKYGAELSAWADDAGSVYYGKTFT